MFITFEGLDGSGKTTQIREATAVLREKGIKYLLTREPGGTYTGDKIREILMEKTDKTPVNPRAELLLFCASRAQLVDEVIRPFWEAGGVVISDRFFDSTYAYQGYGHGLKLSALRSIVNFATGGLTPDLTIYFEISPEEALRRRQKASLFGEEFNRLDDMQLEFRQRVYKGYRKLIKRDPERWVTVDASQSIKAVQTDLLRILAKHLEFTL